MQDRPRVTFFATTLAALALASAAQAYVRVHPFAKHELARWPSPTIELELDGKDMPVGISRPALLAAIEQAARAWSYPAVPCTTVEVRVRDGRAQTPAGEHDRRNSIGFHQRYWCEAGIAKPGTCYDPRVASFTTHHFGDIDPIHNHEATIEEADVELNAVDFTWTVDSSQAMVSAERPLLDVKSVVMHELGHVLGLAHVCDYNLAGITNDDQHGASVPRCEHASPELRRALMAPGADQALRGPTAAPRALGTDEIEALCTLYPRPKPSFALAWYVASAAAAAVAWLAWARSRNGRGAA